jgi:polynucleotide 5'-hydroxyl-kinase GRC3/NOL9
MQQPPQIIAVIGHRNTGKSTFCRFLANQLLSNNYSQICFLDCDLGQPELTPSNMVSLHILDSPLLGAPFTHIKKPISSSFFGQTSPLNDPDYYLTLLTDLITTYNSKYSHLPLVINTSGWIKGFAI